MDHGDRALKAVKDDKEKIVNVGLTLPVSTLKNLKLIHLATSVLLSDPNTEYRSSFYTITFSEFINIILQSAVNGVLDNVSLSPPSGTTFFSIRIKQNLKEKLEHVIEEKKFFYGDYKKPDFNKIVKYKLLSSETNAGTYRILFYILFIKLIFILLRDEFSTDLLEDMLLKGNIPKYSNLYGGIFKYVDTLWFELYNCSNGKDSIDNTLFKKIDVQIARTLIEIHEEKEKERIKLDPTHIVKKITQEYYEEWVDRTLTRFVIEIYHLPILLGDMSIYKVYSDLETPLFLGPLAGLMGLYLDFDSSVELKGESIDDFYKLKLLKMAKNTIMDITGLKEF